jgi:Ca-activated chloride channel family protein
MNPQILVAILCGVVVALLVALAEWLHARRVQRVGRLAFGTEERPRPWIRIVAPLRCLCLGGFAWGLATLILLSSGLFEAPPAKIGSGTRHLVFIIDLSPSMYLEDAGPKRDQSRRMRMAEVVGGILDRVGGDVTFSVVGFYTNAMPVVLQVRDRAVVRNAFDGMPLVYAMAVGKTDLATSISKSMELIEPFPKRSASVFICTDGDSVAASQPLITPASVERVTVLGVGDTERGTFIDGHQSRQDVTVLSAVASALKGEYLDINDRHVPTTALTGLVQAPSRGSKISLVDAAIFVMGLTASLLAFIPVAQQYAGTGWRVRKPAQVSAPPASIPEGA